MTMIPSYHAYPDSRMFKWAVKRLLRDRFKMPFKSQLAPKMGFLQFLKLPTRVNIPTPKVLSWGQPGPRGARFQFFSRKKAIFEVFWRSYISDQVSVVFFLSNPYSWPSDDVAWGKKIFDLRHCFINKMLSTLDFASGLKTNIAPNIYPETEVPPGSPHHRDYFEGICSGLYFHVGE